MFIELVKYAFVPAEAELSETQLKLTRPIWVWPGRDQFRVWAARAPDPGLAHVRPQSGFGPRPARSDIDPGILFFSPGIILI